MENSEIPNNAFVLQKRIGAGIRSIRESKGIKNYEKFAIQNKFSRSHYWNIEQGEVNLTMKTLVRILNSLDVNIKDFFQQLK
ncbi:MAG: helix-turn-helix transcriptional regulator [Reichenbachiella sp.]|uniref:helix-turn-helix domain-containing protein n=1 Tax=Reichenbachiella sp. TaxID=2184521 RepID=UPI003264F60F